MSAGHVPLSSTWPLPFFVFWLPFFCLTFHFTLPCTLVCFLRAEHSKSDSPRSPRSRFTFRRRLRERMSINRSVLSVPQSGFSKYIAVLKEAELQVPIFLVSFLLFNEQCKLIAKNSNILAGYCSSSRGSPHRLAAGVDLRCMDGGIHTQRARAVPSREGISRVSS